MSILYIGCDANTLPRDITAELAHGYVSVEMAAYSDPARPEHQESARKLYTLISTLGYVSQAACSDGKTIWDTNPAEFAAAIDGYEEILSP